MIALFRRRYGASPLHLLALLTSFALAGYAVTRVLADNGPLLNIGIWFVGAAIGHDAVLYPLYAVTDIAAHNRLLRRHRPPPSLARVPWINHLRVPVALSGLLMLVWFPLILGGRDAAFAAATGLHTDVYMSRWLGITAALFLGSAIVYAVRLGRAIGRTREAAAAHAAKAVQLRRSAATTIRAHVISRSAIREEPGAVNSPLAALGITVPVLAAPPAQRERPAPVSSTAFTAGSASHRAATATSSCAIMSLSPFAAIMHEALVGAHEVSGSHT